MAGNAAAGPVGLAGGGGQVQGAVGSGNYIIGTEEGYSLQVRDSIFKTSGVQPVVVMADWAGLCDSKGLHPDTNVLVFFLHQEKLKAGTWQAPQDVGVQWSRFGATCSADRGNSVSSGTVTLTRVEGSRIAGTFELIMGNGDPLRGAFDAPLCSTPEAVSTTCTPL